MQAFRLSKETAYYGLYFNNKIIKTFFCALYKIRNVNFVRYKNIFIEYNDFQSVFIRINDKSQMFNH